MLISSSDESSGKSLQLLQLSSVWCRMQKGLQFGFVSPVSRDASVLLLVSFLILLASVPL
jgi:hypothetical protein